MKTTACYLSVCAPLCKSISVLELNCMILCLGCFPVDSGGAPTTYDLEDTNRCMATRVLVFRSCFSFLRPFKRCVALGIRGRACVRATDVKMEVDIKPPQGQTCQNEMHRGFLLHWLWSAGFFHFVRKQKVRRRRKAW